jgi:hypothetical protein
MTAAGPCDDRALIDQALRALPVCITHCTCPDHWHVLWAGLKTIGLVRTVHGQQDFLRTLLPRFVKPAPHVMVAGAADTGSLDVLCSALDDPAAHYTVLDLCEAPLQLLRDRAAERSLSLQTVRMALDEARTDRPWDLVFIHYTLGFMSAAQRLQFMHRLRQGLAAGGTVVCAVRQKQPPATPPADLPASRQQRADDWAREIEPRLEQSCAARPELMPQLRQWLPAYALSRMQREDTMPTARTVTDEFAGAGFRLLEEHHNPGQAGFSARDLRPAGNISSWMGVFAADVAA